MNIRAREMREVENATAQDCCLPTLLTYSQPVLEGLLPPAPQEQMFSEKALCNTDVRNFMLLGFGVSFLYSLK